MSPVVFLLLTVGAGYYLFKNPSNAAKLTGDAPTDANSLFASILAPSLTDINVLANAYTTFLAAAKNQALNSPAQNRLAQYALVAFLKAAMLSKGAQPDPNELLMIGNAPFAGGVGLVSYGDASVDQMQAVAAALAPSYANMAGLGQYITGLANAAKATGTPRLTAYLLAIKAKQMLLGNPIGIPAAFNDAEQFPSEVAGGLFAIANIPAANIVKPQANSILAYQ